MISSRYSLPVAALLLLALIPTVIHTYLGSTMDDGKSVKVIDERLAGLQSKPSNRNAGWGEDIFDSSDWIEREYDTGGKQPLKFFAARSYNQKRLYHHPEIALSRGVDLRSDGLVRVKDGADIPIHLYRAENGSGAAAYALLYEDKFIAKPVTYQLRNAFRQMFATRKLMTLFYVSDATLPAGKKFENSQAASLLMAAIDSFQRNNR